MATIGPTAPSKTFVENILNPTPPSPVMSIPKNSLFAYFSHQPLIFTLFGQSDMTRQSTVFLRKSMQFPPTIATWKRHIVPRLLTLDSLYASPFTKIKTLDSNETVTVSLYPEVKINGHSLVDMVILSDGIVYWLA